MTKKTEFICDYCRNNHFDNAEIIGLYWLGKALKIVPLMDTEHHLCRTCIQAIADTNKILKTEKNNDPK